MRWIILVGMGIVVVAVFFFNRQPITLYFLGNSQDTALLTFTLPLAVWILLFTLAGIVTSLLIQLLTLGRNSPQSRTGSGFRRPRQPFTPPRQPSGEFSARESEWERNLEDEGWNIEQPPAETTLPRYEENYTDKRPVIEDRESIKEDEPRNQSPNFETSQTPKTASRQGSVYSYTYRESSSRSTDVVKPTETPQDTKPKDSTPPSDSSPKKPSNSVYDANYRIITPPQPETPNSQREEGEEDWI